jgi:predicted dehydrogenase
MSTLRIGIIGAGTAGGRHAAAYRQTAEVRIAAVVDPDEQRGAALAAETNALYLRDATEPFWDAVDAVSVCPPHALLAESALSAIAHGKHLLIEKPMALTLADADRIIAAAADAEIILMVGFVHRFRAEISEAHRRIRSGMIGQPTFAVEHLISGGGPTPGWIWQRSLAGGGVLLYNGVHGLDRLRWLIGSEATEVYARATTAVHASDVEDILVATLTYANGATASFVQHIAPYLLPPGWRSEVYGTQGAILVAPDLTMTAVEHHRTVMTRPERDDRFLGETREFVAAIGERRAPSITGMDGRAALATALALYESAATGQPVSVPPATTV